jgi:hypothetical protein
MTSSTNRSPDSKNQSKGQSGRSSSAGNQDKVGNNPAAKPHADQSNAGASSRSSGEPDSSPDLDAKSHPHRTTEAESPKASGEKQARPAAKRDEDDEAASTPRASEKAGSTSGAGSGKK